MQLCQKAVKILTASLDTAEDIIELAHFERSELAHFGS